MESRQEGNKQAEIKEGTTTKSSELDPDANHNFAKPTTGGIVSGLEEGTLRKEESVLSGLGLPPEAKHQNHKESREGKNKGSSSSSSSSSIKSGEHLGLLNGREEDPFDDSFNKLDPESVPGSECPSPPDVLIQTPQWSMISASPRTGPAHSFSRELPPTPEWSISNSPMKSPLTQMMGRAAVPGGAGYDPHRIPSSIFSTRPTTPMEWSVASNESLFSIHMGNNSFSRDHVFFMGDSSKLEEWTNSSSHTQNVSDGKAESNNFVTNLSPVRESGSENNKKSVVDVRKEEEPKPSVEPQKSQKIATPITEVRQSTAVSNSPDRKVVSNSPDRKVANPTNEVTPNTGARVSNESGNSSGSFAFPV